MGMSVDLQLIVQKLLLYPRHSKPIKSDDVNAVAPTSAARVFHRRQSRLDVYEQSISNKLCNLGNPAEVSPPELALGELSEEEVIFLVMETRKLFMSQPMLIEIQAPVNLCGDIHGQYDDLLRLFELGGYPPESNYLFLGDYVDRGDKSLETVCLLMAYKLLFPEAFFLLRGNHETSSINRIYGFFDECKRRFNVKLWKLFTDTFNCMPVAAMVVERILCMHGGLSPELQSLDQIRRILRPTDVPDSGLICDLLWADPADEESMGWGGNDRGVSWTFGADVVGETLARFNLDLICRAHQVVEEGYNFFADRRLVTVFSAPNYCGEFNNFGAFLTVNEKLVCSIVQLAPTQRVSSPY